MSQCAFFPMTNPIQGYEWGSRHALTRLFGIANPDEQPQAELWMGAHPSGCSLVEQEGQLIRLDALIAADPAAMLGEATVTRFGTLPFLFKVLCAEKALSIQVHPSKAQAEAGFARDNEAGLAPNAPHRNYRDDNHKPELVFALTPYQAMNGFRPHAEILALFERLASPALAPLVEAFAHAQHEAGLATLFRALLTLQGAQKEAALADLARTAAACRTEETFALILHLFEQYPGDVGLFAPLLLNVVTLQPGQAMFLDACTPHAYVRGTGLEIMANSDNVLRAGLTPKHMDVDELLACTRCEPKPAAEILLAPRREGRCCHFQVPVPDFTFRIYEAGEHELQGQSAEVIFAIDAPLTLVSGEQRLSLAIGHSAFVPASTPRYRVESEGRFARAGNR
ncbi:mannose-6-phosphate isomerase, class I [Aeromonas schubertii]|uniref:mannose-6-phosphate isomerase, class I n=1 Tax=Aeromonas schubertii TaxID=652 RepID=UPI001CC3FAEE|nr:mannose-6-phosphate isomerase, class I [Aeromonas schubertii]MBZ6070911.1 mannose-6-phosphate isomerase, class I [Aeromonas schubertii]